MSYRTTEIAMAAGLVVLTVLGWFQIRDLPVDARMFPAVLLGVIGVLSCCMVIRGVIGRAAHLRAQSAQQWSFAISAPRMVLAFALLGAYFVVLPFVGFFTSSFVFIMLVGWIAGYRKPVPLALAAAGFCAFVYMVFVALFDRPLPPEFFLTLFATNL
ncbi:hypothetical protein BFP70_10420 [Thioclava sp. SK-1]|uniref:tripartite tricarboxylate transporter TctB family protein n=1 Tax=Thioclava sp. SK-1 TaxID=1889770 RepID=UPI000824E046|nr:tripartite tricarboxylate transporter TctB family protein [Thioclava sp. SK-1]OCX64459.1 hypothetical protein BFP70_10420 [Thioclava sp. SK-1]